MIGLEDLPESVSRTAPATDNPYANLASAILHQACTDLIQDGTLAEWLASDDCKFWCQVVGLPHSLFIEKVKEYYEV